MFYATHLKPGHPVKLSAEDGGEVLHLSQVCITKPVDGNRTYLKVIQGSQSFAACVLQKDKQESCSIDLFLSTREGIQLAVEGGKNELSVIGYFEPEPESESEDDGMAEFGEESDESEDISDDETEGMSAPVMKDGRIEDLDAEEEEAKKQKPANKKAALKALQAAAAADDASGDEDESDEEGNEGDDDDDDDDDEGESGEEEGSDEDEDGGDEEEEESEEEAPSPADNKRKGQQQQQQQPNKKAKTQGGAATAGKGDEATYRNALVEFLKKNGRTPLASLGQKVKKPASIAKMAGFLKANSNVFNVEGGFCSLK